MGSKSLTNIIQTWFGNPKWDEKSKPKLALAWKVILGRNLICILNDLWTRSTLRALTSTGPNFGNVGQSSQAWNSLLKKFQNVLCSKISWKFVHAFVRNVANRQAQTNQQRIHNLCRSAEVIISWHFDLTDNFQQKASRLRLYKRKVIEYFATKRHYWGRENKVNKNKVLSYC